MATDEGDVRDQAVVASKFRLKELLGRGAMGEVHRAVDQQTGDEVAVKRMTLRTVQDLEALDRFERGSEALKRLDSPQLPRVYAHGVEDGTAYLATEVFEGGSLYDRICARRHLSPTQVRQLLTSLLELLDLLHGQSPPVLHRDIKPQNIMFRTHDDWTPVLVDFDTVAAPPAERGGMTIVGTPGYTAPEQLIGDASAASDLFSLGATMLFVTTHVEPDDLPRVAGRFDPGERLEGLDPGLRKVLLGLVEPVLEQRYESAREALEDLKRRAPRGKPVVEPAPADKEVRRRRALSRKAKIQLAVLGVIVLLIVLAFRDSFVRWLGHVSDIELAEVATLQPKASDPATLSLTMVGKSKQPLVLLGGSDGKVRSWFGDTGKPAHTWDLGAPVQRFFPYFYTSSSQEGTYYRTVVGAVLQEEEGLTLAVWRVGDDKKPWRRRLGFNGKPLLVGTYDAVAVGAIGGGLELYEHRWLGLEYLGRNEPLLQVPVSASGVRLAALGWPEAMINVLVTADGDDQLKLFVIRHEPRKAKVLEVKALTAEDAHRRPITALAVSQSGPRCLVAVADAERILIWKLPEGDFQRELTGHDAKVNGLAFGAGELLAAALDDGRIVLWHVEQPGPVKSITAHTGPALAVAFHHDKKLIVSSGADSKIRIWLYQVLWELF